MVKRELAPLLLGIALELKPVAFGILHLAPLWGELMARHLAADLPGGKDLADGSLIELMPQYRSIKLGIYAVYPPTRKHVAAKVRALIDFLANHFDGRAPTC